MSIPISSTFNGKGQKSHGESWKTLIASLTTSSIIFVFGAALSTAAKLFFPHFYARLVRLSTESWQPSIIFPRLLFQAPPYTQNDLLHLDNYFFSRYLHMLARVFLWLAVFIIPVLVPLNLIGGLNQSGGIQGLDRLSFSNVGPAHTNRYWAHLLVALVCISNLCWLLRYEFRLYKEVTVRTDEQSHVIVSSLRRKPCLKAIHRHLNGFAGGIRLIQANRDLSSLRAKLHRRNSLLRKLELAETTFIMKASFVRSQSRACSTSPAPFAPYQEELERLRTMLSGQNIEIERQQRHPETLPVANSVVVQFNRSFPMTLANLYFKARIPPHWTLERCCFGPDAVWSHGSVSLWEQVMRTTIVCGVVVILVLGFAVPVSMLGALSQVQYLMYSIPWLHWMQKLPSWTIAMIQGVLPPTLLALITAAVPIIVRGLANTQGLRSRKATENHIQVYYFTFLFIQEFFAVSLSAGFATTSGEWENMIQSVPTILAQNLPKASNYFCSYFVIYTLMTVSSIMTQAGVVINLILLSPILDKTPRQKWRREAHSGVRCWGTFLPVITNIACIGLVYSVIAPLILVFGLFCFGSLWLAFCFFPPKLTPFSGTRARFYPTAIYQLFTGIYVLEVCLGGLFLLIRDNTGNAACTVQGAIMLTTVPLTMVFQFFINHDSNIRDHAKFTNLPHTALKKDFHQDRVLNSPRPVVWVPTDSFQISKREVSDMCQNYAGLSASSVGAIVNEKGCVMVYGPPPT